MRVSDLDFRDISERLILSVMNYEQNFDRLDSYPHVIKGDMVLVCQLCVGEKNKEGLYTSCLTVTNDLLGKWNMDKDILFTIAAKNGKELMKPSIEQVSVDKDEFGFNFNYVLTNAYHFNGASSMFYDSGMIEKLGNKVILLPVSSNEVYIISPVPEENEEHFIDTVEELYQEFKEKSNAVLSEHALIYDKGNPGVLSDTEGNSFHLNLNEYMLNEESETAQNMPARSL